MDETQRDFIIFFEQKEGTTAIVRLLNGFPGVDVIRAGGVFEPFDPHVCGPMSTEAQRDCLELIFSRRPVEEANRIYRRTSKRPLSPYHEDTSLGFKSRFEALADPAPIIDLLVRHRVLVFLAIRQDLFRWALSRYHGDGTGKPGHLQVRLASGQIARDDIPRIAVDEDELARVIERCERLHARKRELEARLRDRGLEVLPLRYEDFLADKEAFYKTLLAQLGQSVTEAEMRAALTRDIRLQRVHGEDLSEFFVNAEALEARFGDRFQAWP